MSTEPIKTLIYGSCVSRDIARITEPRFEVTRYIARQSWVSAFTGPLADPGPTELTSAFQQRSLVGDFTSNAFDLIAEAAPQSDLVLLDIDCELRGVFPLDGGYVSNTPELARSGALQSRDPGPLLKFGAAEHLELFVRAAEQLRNLLAEAGAMDRTVVVRFPFTDESTTGDSVPLLAGRSGAEWNAAYLPYYQLIEDMGFSVSSLPTELGVSTPDHQWGIQQEHYVDDAYRWWADEVAPFSRPPALRIQSRQRGEEAEEPAPQGSAPVRAVVYGSVLARDVLRVAPEPFDEVDYITRQSWVSAFTSPIPAPDLSHMASAAQARNVRGDFESNARERLAGETDVILLDIATELSGVATYQGGYVTLTPDHRRAFGRIVPGARAIPFGTDEHFELFKAAGMQLMEDLLVDLDIHDRTFVLKAPFTDRTTTGEPLRGVQEPAETINEEFLRYYQFLGAAGFQILTLPDDLAVADPDHQWGPGQDHYSDPAYRWWADQIIKRYCGPTTRGEGTP